ncbi:MAG: Nif11-like leader peptide family natural product precursor [Bacteroidota bacterium]|nr:Nif11-like leader peptide family natural product precursor [Bacteroidota bacterium]
MSKQSVEDLLIKGGSDKEYRIKYDNALSEEKFVELAIADGYEFTVTELKEVLKENGDMFESYGNPPKKSIWLK